MILKNHFNLKNTTTIRENMKKIVQSPNAPEPIGPYSQAVQAGKFLFVSGQLAIDPHQGKFVSKDITQQTRQVMANIKAILEAANYSLKDVVSVNVYLSSMALFEDFNREYARYFESQAPARATVGIQLKSDALVEISVIACKE